MPVRKAYLGGQRAFAGSTRFWRTERTPGVMSIAAGTLTPPTGLKTMAAIYTDYASDYHIFDEDIDSYSEDR